LIIVEQAGVLVSESQSAENGLAAQWLSARLSRVAPLTIEA